MLISISNVVVVISSLARHISNRNVVVGSQYDDGMAWDTEKTRRRLKEAATAEFAEHGPDGTTMSRIAQRAGINKERLYKYFGDKQALFEAVLSDELERLAASVALPAGRGLEEIGEFAGRIFDYHTAHPGLVRLLLWEGLGDGPVADAANRTAHYKRKAQIYAAAQRDGVLDDGIDPDHLVFLIIALSAWWVAVPQLAGMLTDVGNGDGDADAEVDDKSEHARRRASVVRAAQRLALPQRRPAAPAG
jgi:AcrR family transcriptional regulator